LGLKTNQYGAVFEWKQAMDSTKKGFTQWSPFSEKSKYFDKEFMINYRVVNLTALIEELRKNGVTIADSVVSDEFGKFVHIVDIEGNKVELWEPNDVAYDNFGKQNRMPTTK
jgi:predicted enzyme related to lactoylglutathione lyase